MESYQRLRQRMFVYTDLERSGALCSWDQQTYMPRGGAGARADQVATLRRLCHELLVDDETGRLLDLAAAEVAGLSDESDEYRLVTVTRRDYENARRIPAALIEDLAKATSTAYEAWAEAREKSNFEVFRPHLERVIALTIRKAEIMTYKESIYDPLLDQFEPDMTASRVSALFEQLKKRLVPLIRRIRECMDMVDDRVLKLGYDPDKQFLFNQALLKKIGFDFDHGRLDISLHPFSTSFSIQDVRLTTRINPDNLAGCLFGSLHEAGHGLYEQGVSLDLERTPLGQGASLGVHESQSRTLENLIGRSRAFWSHFFPGLQETFPGQLGNVDLETFYRAINRVEPSFIRVDADEVTYNIHTLLRFEIEVDLLTGKLKAAELPDAWNAKMQEYLGVAPPDDVKGVLQDIHWSEGLIGYFPTYTLGNIISVQLFDALRDEIPHVDELIGSGQLGPVLGWYKEKLHRHGRKFTAAELVHRITGGDLDVSPYVTYLEEKYGDIYSLS